MSAPILATCAVVVVAFGVPVVIGGGALLVRQNVVGAADSAALAAADAVSGWVMADPCELASEVAVKMSVKLVSCSADPVTGLAQVTVSAWSQLGGVTVTARAGPPQ